MATFIPTVPGIGAALGTGLSKSLETLAESKIKKMIEAPQNDRIAQIMSLISGAPAGQPNQAAQQAQPSIDQLSGQQQQQQQAPQQRPPITREQFQTLLSGLPPGLQAQAVAAYQGQQKAEAQERRHQENKSLQERTLIHKIAGSELTKSADRAASARKNIGLLDNIIKVVEKGDVRSGVAHSALSAFGLQRWGANIDTQLAQAMINDYNASQIQKFSGKGQLTNAKLQLLTDAGPALWKNPAGIIAVSKNLKLAEQAEVVLDDAENQVVDEFGVNLPVNWKSVAAKRAAPKLQKLTDKAARNVEDVLNGKYDDVINSYQGSLQGNPEGGQGQSPQGGSDYNIGEDASNLLRNTLRSGSRVLEMAGGATGSGLSIVPNLLNAVSGGATPSYEDLQKKVPILPPTISQVTNFAQEKSGGYLSPKNESEKFSDDVISDLATFLAPIGGQVPFRNSIIKAVGGNAAAWLTKSLGGSPLAQGVIKLGFNVAASLPGGRKSLEDLSKTSLEGAKKLTPGETVPKAAVHNVAAKIADQYSKDRVAAPFVKERADNLANLTKTTGGSSGVDLNELWESAKNLNGFISDSKTPPQAIAPLKLMVGAINKTIKDHAPKKFVDLWSRGNEIHAGLKSASDTSKFLKENLDKPTLDLPVVSWLVKNWAAPIGKGAIKLGKNLIFGRAAEKALDASSWFDLIKRSPHARQYYLDLVKASLGKDVLTAKKSAEKLNKVVINHLSRGGLKGAPQPEEQED
jgi:hypothetical protein